MWETNHPIIRLKEILCPVRRVIRPQAGETYRLLGVKWYGEGCRIQGEYSGDTLQTPSLSQVQAGDIVYNKMWTSKGSFATVTDDYACAWTTSEFPAFTPVDGVYSDYLAFVFRQPRFWALAKAWSVGTTERSRLNPSEFLRMPIPLPCPTEQRAIADILCIVDKTTARTLAVIEQLRVAKRVVMSKLLTCGIPGKHLRYKKTVIGEIPNGWEVTPIGKIARVGNGSTPNRSRRDFWEGGTIPWVTSGKVHDVLITSADEYITPQAREECSLRVIPAGSILVAITGQGKTRGTVATLSIDSCTNQHIAALTIHDQRMHGPFLLAYLSSQYDALRRSSEGAGSTRAALTCAGLAAIIIPIPPMAEQCAIADIGEVYDQRIKAESAYLVQLTEAKCALAQGLLSGAIQTNCHETVGGKP